MNKKIGTFATIAVASIALTGCSHDNGVTIAAPSVVATTVAPQNAAKATSTTTQNTTVSAKSTTSATSTSTTSTGSTTSLSSGTGNSKPFYTVPGANGKKVIAITFDDGPSPYTPKVLAILQQEGIKATFFELGNNVVKYPQYTKMLVNAGMSVQNHTYAHAALTTQSDSVIESVITRTDNAIQNASGETATCVRPPYGANNHRTNAELASLGKNIIMWNSDSEDWSLPGVTKIIHNAMMNARPGSIILFHDGGGNRSETIAALPQVINKLKAEGYTFVTLCK